MSHKPSARASGTRGFLLVLSGPSGVGKSTLIEALRQAEPRTVFSVSATTRLPRAGEQDGKDYHFMDKPAFEAMVQAGGFLEYAQVYSNFYGTPLAPMQAQIDAGRVVVLDIDAQGSKLVRQTDLDAVHVFLLPPDMDTLERRLRSRGTESDATIAMRLVEVAHQFEAVGLYDYVLVNDEVKATSDALYGIVQAELARPSRTPSLVAHWESEAARIRTGARSPSPRGSQPTS